MAKPDESGLERAKRIMERLVKTPHKPHRDIESEKGKEPKEGARRKQRTKKGCN